MFRRKKHYYHVEDKPKHSANKKILSSFVAFFIMGLGVYLFVLLQSPEILVTEAADSTEETTLINNNQDFVKIERINLLVPFDEGADEAVLEKGAWHRFPERGDPVNGGNFILSAHRFQLGVTPNETKERSPFYHIDKLQQDDVIDVFYDRQWYSYRINKTFSVEPDAIEIEEPSDSAKLTLYSCTLKGSADGRVVIEAIPIARTGDSGSGGALLL